ncbi:MAG: pirin family protein [Gammaproteobacteria bacterium]
MPILVDTLARELDGVSLRRALPQPGLRAIGPIVFVDHLGPADLAPGQGIDVRPHPHIGLSTVSYLLDGAIVHRDSLGHVQRLAPGGVNWMRAGRGIAHSERSPPDLRAAGHRLHLLQCWVAAARAGEDAPPAFTHWPADAVPRVLAPGIDLRLVAGRGFNRELDMPIDPPCAIAVLRLARLMRFEFLAEYAERAVYVMSGRVQIGSVEIATHGLARLDAEAGHTVHVDALEPSVLALLAGDPIGERTLWWNFVASDPARIEAAKARWLAGDFPPVPDDDERMPLPAG